VKPYGGKISIPVDFVPITPSAACPVGTRGILATVAGTITVTMRNGQARTAIPIAANSILSGEFASITAATATGLFCVI
jgi:hypothetical protein